MGVLVALESGGCKGVLGREPNFKGARSSESPACDEG
jgi:hypothetical protein